MATIKELEANREKLRKYDELKGWKEVFEDKCTMVANGVLPFFIKDNAPLTKLPDNIKAIIVNALQSEIEKLDEE